MKWTILISPVLLATAVPALPQPQRNNQAQLTEDGLPLRLVTFNIRFDATYREPGEKPWWDIFCNTWPSRCRMPHVSSHLRSLVATAPRGSRTIISLQEALKNQLHDIQSRLGSSWAHIGVGRDDGKSKGEHCPILYDTTALRLIHAETKWLSDTPDKVSKMKGTGHPRVVTIGVFEDLATGERFIHANTHLEAWVGDARAEQVKVVVAQLRGVQEKYGPLPVSLAGDFNSAPGEDAYETMLQSGYMKELWDVAEHGARAGVYETTYTTFTPGQEESRLDFLWVGPNEDQYEVRKYEIMNNVEKGMYISDHRAVVGDVFLKKSE